MKNSSRMWPSFASNGFGNLAPPFFMLFVSVLLARELGVDGRGEVGAAVAPYLLATSIAAFGVPDAVTYFVARHGGVTRQLARFATAIMAGGGAAVAVAFFCLRGVLSGGLPSVATGMAWASLAIVPVLFVGLVRGVAAGLGLWRLVATEKFVGAASRLIAILILQLMNELNSVNAAIAIAFGPAVGLVVYLGLPYSSSVCDIGPRHRYSVYGKYSMKIWIGSIAGILLMRIDQVLIVPLSDVFELGLYIVAVNVGEVILVVSNTVREVIFSADAQKSDDKRLARAARLTALASGILVLLISVSAPIWFPTVFGEEFRDATPLAVVMLIAVLLGVPGSIAGAGLSARGKPELRSIALVIACVLNVALLLVLVPPWGAWGAVLATLLGNLLSSNLNVVFMKRNFGHRFRDYYGIRYTDFSALNLRAISAREVSSER
ncbi:lipopolysaccharide biosynthesis protein [Rhodococcus opacus]|uniref:lipopolysaccharide biosynthesis protein n=1 Tax=Rhodococcus opacus TaxID=37919 RepID=UPI0011D17424|nr:polysaccharide biosynthesis C-terminal domain-containing protein [Rhodococcus opacus]